MVFRAVFLLILTSASAIAHTHTDTGGGHGAGGFLQTSRQIDGHKLSEDMKSATRFVHDPKPQSLTDMRAAMTADMHEMEISTPIGDSVKLFGYPSSEDIHVSGSVLRTGSWDSGLVNSVYTIFKENNFSGHFFDVGGNIGTYTVPLAHALYGRSKVFTVEGLPSIASHLKKGVLENKLDNVFLYEYALSGPVSDDSLNMSLNPTNKGGSAVTGNKEWTSDDHIQKFSVPLTTVDAMQKVTPELGYVLVAKMDIEGNEGQALLGAKEFLASSPPCYLFIELQPEWLKRAGTTIESVLKQLEDANYDTSTVNPTAVNTYKLPQRDMPSCVNRLAIHKQQKTQSDSVTQN